MINININEEFITQINKPMIKKAARISLRKNGKKPFNTEVTITITTGEEIRELNRTYRQVDAVTDVLSFEADHTDPESGRNYLGDVIICFPTAKAQAETAKHPINVELAVLTIHGILHLMGYDHSTQSEKNTMWAMQEEIFEKISIHPKQLPEN